MKDNEERDNGRARLSKAAKLLAVAAGAAGAAAAGYYFYASKNAPRNRQKVARWATDFKDDVVRQAREIEDLDREAIIGIVDGVARAYEKIRGMNRADLREAAEELKHNWRRLSSELDRGDRHERIGSGGARSKTKRASKSRSRGRARPRQETSSKVNE